jgi:alcohol dehydrogenase (cytochrome c)
MRIEKLLLTAAIGLWPGIAPAQGLDPTEILKPLGNAWPTYSGDYSGKRHSTLTQINQSNVKHLTLSWTSRLTAGSATGGGGGFGGFGGRGGPAAPLIIGGEGTGDAGGGGGVNVRASILQVNGILYLAAPDNAWAVDARDGHELWHYFWKTKGGTHIGNRGLGMWHDRLYMETPDDYLVCLDAKTGKEIWHKEIADFSLQYFSTMAPIVVGNHVLVGTGDDLDEPGFLQSFDPETGAVQWKWYSVPMEKTDKGAETWSNIDAARHGGGQVWIPGSYDPDTHLYIFGTGNPTPAYTGQSRGELDNLYTCALVAVNVDTGKMAWYYQVAPHDTHDWDATQTPILVDGEFGGRPRKLVMTAERNGYFFVLDRLTGEHLVTSKFSDAVNWAKGLNKAGAPVRDPEKDSTVGGSLLSPDNGGATNWPPPAFDPTSGLFFVPSSDTYAMYYLTETDPRGAMGLGGKDEQFLTSFGSYLTAIDYKTGKIAWRHKYPSPTRNGGNGLLTTAGKLLFAGDPGGNLVAYDPANGKILWHSHIGNVSNAPQTYMVDGHQYVLVAAGDTLFSFSLY